MSRPGLLGGLSIKATLWCLRVEWMDLGQILISTFDRLDPNLMPCDAAFSDVSLGPDGLPLVTPFSIVYIHHECRHSSPYCHVASVVIECGYATKMQCMLCKASYCSSLFGASGRVQSEAAQTWCGLKGLRAPSESARRTSAANAGVGPVCAHRQGCGAHQVAQTPSFFLTGTSHGPNGWMTGCSMRVSPKAHLGSWATPCTGQPLVSSPYQPLVSSSCCK